MASTTPGCPKVDRVGVTTFLLYYRVHQVIFYYWDASPRSYVSFKGYFSILMDLLFSIPPNYMQRLFGIEQESQQGIVTVPEWEYVRQGLTKNLNTVVDYYHRFASRMDSSHFLIKLVTAMGISRTLPLERFYAHAQARAMNTSMALGMTSSINRGVLFDGVFYGKGVKEILIAHDEDFDFNKAALNWEWLEPIRVLSHPKSDLNINIPDGISTSVEDGVAVIAINVPMLVLQYRQWRLTRNDIAVSLTESPRSIMQFLFSYPLTNMAYSHLDCAIFNRLYNLLIGAPMGESRVPHSFLLNDYSDKLTYVQQKQLELLKKVPLKFNSMMRTIPLVTDGNLATFAKLPNCAPTFQVVWGLTVSRLQLLSFLFRASGVDPRVRNASEVNRILRQFKLFRTDQALRSSLPLDLYLNAKNNLDRILLV